MDFKLQIKEIIGSTDELTTSNVEKTAEIVKSLH